MKPQWWRSSIFGEIKRLDAQRRSIKKVFHIVIFFLQGWLILSPLKKFGPVADIMQIGFCKIFDWERCRPGAHIR